MKIWGITGGRRGNDVLVEGVATALLGAKDGDDFRLIHTDLRAPYKWLAPYRLAERAAKADPQIEHHIKSGDWPDMVIASGRQAVPHARYIKRASGGRVFTVFLQNPLINPKHFDLVWAPEHDRLNGPNVMSTLLSPHGMTLEGLIGEARNLQGRLLPSQPLGKVVTVLIGGPNAVYPFKEDEMRALVSGLARLAEAGHQLLITLSRRSPETYQTLLRQKLPGGSYFLWDSKGANPYRAMLGLADHIIVTGDSVNMVGEACLPGVPVHVFGLRGGSAKFRRFHKAVLDNGYVLPFAPDEQDGTLQERPHHSFNATPDIAAAIGEAYARHAAQFGLS
jgi:mitochondrial fission protein ELM1